jgi:hypothetical protein
MQTETHVCEQMWRDTGCGDLWQETYVYEKNARHLKVERNPNGTYLLIFGEEAEITPLKEYCRYQKEIALQNCPEGLAKKIAEIVRHWVSTGGPFLELLALCEEVIHLCSED